MRFEEVRKSLVGGLRERRSEIEQATLTRIRSISDTAESPDIEYIDGLPAVVSAALEHGIAAVERGEDRPQPIPTALLSQARLAARNGIRLETVLRRYLAGYTLLGDFIVEESERLGPLRGNSLKQLLRVQAAVLDRLISAVSEEYAREAKTRPGSVEQRLVERIRQLLAGELVDTSGLAYDFEACHLGFVGTGPRAADAISAIAKVADGRPLLVRHDKVTVWGWLGFRRGLDQEELGTLVSRTVPAGVTIAIGEPGEGLAGWRLTHRQAQAALPIALRSDEAVVRYCDVALVASMLRDDLLTASLRELYLEPLVDERDGGAVARRTLEAYFSAERNISSAAAILGVSRQAVSRRLRAVEERIGRPLSACAAELEAALRVGNITSRPASPTTG
jgi:hypothetical protein